MPLRFFPARLEKRRTYPEFNLFHTVLIEFDNAFAIADDDVEEYLFNFLDRYAKQNGGMFDCFGETLYSYETVEKMLADIARRAAKLRGGKGSAAARSVGSGFPPEAVADFYERFVARLQSMMRGTPQANLLCVEGL